jgi:hypothetical protein
VVTAAVDAFSGRSTSCEISYLPLTFAHNQDSSLLIIPLYGFKTVQKALLGST